ncbi:MAG: HEAT repeat domain-containing protein [Thermodesulfobacteriota bacterium]
MEHLKKTGYPHRHIYIQIAADLKLREAVPALIDILHSESPATIIVECIRALGAIGSQESISALLGYIDSADMALREAGVSALTEIGNKAVVEGLSNAIVGDKRDKSIVEGLAAIQTRNSMEKLSGFLRSDSADLRSLVIDSLIKIGPKAVPSLIDQLESNDSDQQVHALTILGKIGDKTAVPAIQQLLYKKPENPNVRFGAYEALGRLPASKAAISLAIGLGDPDEQVCLAAAKAIDKNLNHVLVAGLKNMISNEDQDARRVVAALIDSGADAVFDMLIDWEPFPSIALDYLVHGAHPEMKNHYLNILTAKGRTELAERIIKETPPEKKEVRPVIYAVDDSTMMLRLYQKKLHAMGYEPVLFQYPAEAIAAVNKSKPALVITDLNMPQINGLQLSKELRSMYDAMKLPIVMITTQSDFIGRSRDKTSAPISEKEIRRAGVDEIIHKPFRDSHLDAVIKKLIGPRP